jgi:predicted nucleotidyltransferase
MTPLLAAIRCIVRDLDGQSHPWALVGGLAVSARTEPRTTRDVDIAVTVPDDPAAEAMVWSLSRIGYVVSGAVEQTDTQRLATIRLHPPSSSTSGVIVDLLFASSGIEPELVARATRMEIVAGLELPVACIGDLIALKVLSRDDDRRPQDAADLRALCRAATPADLAVARQSLALITARGFHRERELQALLERALQAFVGLGSE